MIENKELQEYYLSNFYPKDFEKYPGNLNYEYLIPDSIKSNFYFDLLKILINNYKRSYFIFLKNNLNYIYDKYLLTSKKYLELIQNQVTKYIFNIWKI